MCVAPNVADRPHVARVGNAHDPPDSPATSARSDGPSLRSRQGYGERGESPGALGPRSAPVRPRPRHPADRRRHGRHPARRREADPRRVLAAARRARRPRDRAVPGERSPVRGAASPDRPPGARLHRRERRLRGARRRGGELGDARPGDRPGRHPDPAVRRAPRHRDRAVRQALGLRRTHRRRVPRAGAPVLRAARAGGRPARGRRRDPQGGRARLRAGRREGAGAAARARRRRRAVAASTGSTS